MTNHLLTAAGLALALAATAPAAMADGPRASSLNNWPGITDPVPAEAAQATPPHYVWHQGYERHGKWRGHWVLVQ